MSMLGLLLGACILAVCFVGAGLEYRNKSPVLLFYVALLAMFSFPTFSVLLTGGAFPRWVYEDASFFALIYMMCFALVRCIFMGRWRLRHVWPSLFDSLRVGDVQGGWLIAAFSVASLILFLRGLEINSVAAAFSLNWWDLVNNNGSPLVLLATYFSYCASSLLILVSVWRKTSPVKFYFSLGQVLVFLLFSIFVLKTRSYVLMLLVPYFYFVFCSEGRRGKIWLLSMGLGTVFLFVLTRAVRHAEDLNQFLSYGLGYFWAGAAEGAEIDFVQVFYFFVYKANAFRGFEENITLQRILLFWLPSLGTWTKPPEFSYLMHSAYFGSNIDEKLSMHPTVFGDAFGNAGYLGAVIYSSLLALFFSIVEYFAKITSSSTVKVSAFSLLCVCSLIFARGAVYNAFMFNFLALILVTAAVVSSAFVRRLSFQQK